MSLVKRYIFWTYERGSFHYDVMVTLILLFIFISPHVIDFRAKPVEKATWQDRKRAASQLTSSSRNS